MIRFNNNDAFIAFTRMRDEGNGNGGPPGGGGGRVAKVVGTVEGGDLGGEALRDAEVASLPGHLFTEFNQPLGSPAYGFFVLSRHRNGVQIDAAGKVEAAFNRGLNDGLQSNDGHGPGTGGSSEGYGSISASPLHRGLLAVPPVAFSI